MPYIEALGKEIQPTMARLNPRIDIAFKKIFGVEENKDLLISLINSIVSPNDHVSDVTLMNPYNLQSFRTDKLSIMDIKAKGHDGKRFNIEIQITDEGDYDKRALLYWSKMYAEQLRVGDGYDSLSKAIGIHILNFTSINDNNYHHEFHINDKSTHERHFDHFEMHTLELSKFSSKNDQLSDLVKKIQTSLDMWMAFLTRNDLMAKDRLPPELNDAHLNKALGVLDVMNLTDEEREAYEGREKFLMIEASAMIKQWQEGEMSAKRAMVKEMLNEGFGDEVVLKITKLTEQELDAIKADFSHSKRAL